VAKEMVDSLMNSMQTTEAPAAPKPAPQVQQPVAQPQMQQQPQVQQQQVVMQVPKPQPVQHVNVQPVQFAPLVQQTIPVVDTNINLIMDVPLQVTVELGRTRKLIRDILELSPGSVIELDKLAGEAVDILVNGKLIAKGEVVVIDDNFGVRITDIVSPLERTYTLQ